MIPPYRIGQGYDIHPLVPERKLILGGVHIESDVGLKGHSDGDALSHAIADAIFGALSLPDIGHFFPDTDPSLSGMDSQEILTKAMEEVHNRHYRVANIDATIVAEKPKLSTYIESIQEKLSTTLTVPVGQIGIKATTHEKLDSIGEGKAIAVHAICLLIHRDQIPQGISG